MHYNGISVLEALRKMVKAVRGEEWEVERIRRGAARPRRRRGRGQRYGDAPPEAQGRGRQPPILDRHLPRARTAGGWQGAGRVRKKHGLPGNGIVTPEELTELNVTGFKPTLVESVAREEQR